MSVLFDKRHFKEGNFFVGHPVLLLDIKIYIYTKSISREKHTFFLESQKGIVFCSKVMRNTFRGKVRGFPHTTPNPVRII